MPLPMCSTYFGHLLLLEDTQLFTCHQVAVFRLGPLSLISCKAPPSFLSSVSTCFDKSICSHDTSQSGSAKCKLIKLGSHVETQEYSRMITV